MSHVGYLFPPGLFQYILLLRHAMGISNFWRCISTYTIMTPFDGDVTQSNFYLRYSHREIILIDFNLTYSKKSEQNVCLIWYRIFDILSLNTITDTFQIQRFPWHTLPQYPTPKPLNMHFTSYKNITHK